MMSDQNGAAEVTQAAVAEQPGADAPLADLRDAEGVGLGASGGRRGNVSGAFFHIIAAEPAAVAIEAPRRRQAARI